MNLTDYLVNVLGLEESELVLGEPAFIFSLEEFEEDK